MPMDADARVGRLLTLRAAEHGDCYVCGQRRAQGLRLAFQPGADGSVRASFECAHVFQGYPEQLHGGIICTLLDGAMTNCLFAHGYVAVTAELTVRFSRPVRVGCAALVTARVMSRGARLFRLDAEVVQNGDVVATATAKFLPRGQALAAPDRIGAGLKTADQREESA